MVERLRKSDLFKIFFRCFVIQGSWNFKALLGLGFCYATIPIARRLYKTEEEQTVFVKRHLEFFNAHPYFASWCLGAVAKLEEEAETRNWDNKNPISIFKERLAGPLGSLGDQFFWVGLKPLTAGIGVTLAFIIGWIAIPVYLIFYNVPHIYIRIKGLFLGYKKGFDIISDLSQRRFKKYFTVFAIAGALVAGFYPFVALEWSYKQDFTYFVVFLLSLIITLIILYLNRPFKWALFISIIIGIGARVILYYSILNF